MSKEINKFQVMIKTNRTMGRPKYLCGGAGFQFQVQEPKPGFRPDHHGGPSGIMSQDEKGYRDDEKKCGPDKWI
jgi:hypothetical protein